MLVGGAWMDRERSEEGRYCLVVGDEAASSYKAERLTTVREPQSEKGKQRDGSRGGTETPPHSSRSQIRCSRELLENEELHGPDQITLQNK